MRRLFSAFFILVLLTVLASWSLYSAWGKIDLRQVPFPPLAGDVFDVDCDDSQKSDGGTCSSNL